MTPHSSGSGRPRRALLAFASLVVLLAIPAASPAVGSTTPPELHRLLDRGGFTDLVEVTGDAWVRRGGGMQAQGGGRGVKTKRHVGRGDFVMRAELVFEDLEESGALFELGDNVFCFAARRDGSPLFVRGPDWHPGETKELVLPGSNGRTPEGDRFVFVVRRDGATLRVLYDDELVHSAEVGDAPLGRVGFQPRRALMRVHAWTLDGPLTDPAVDRGALLRLQPAIDEAIDAGVDALIALQQRDGSWEYEGKRYRNGQTALSMYTLLKCGVDPAHPAIQRARAFLEAAPARETYAIACQMMAFEATKDPALKPRIGEMLDWLLEWQNGGWSYPWDHAWENWHEREGLIDLSNSQYAALGLRAAALAGHEVPERAWKRLLKDTLNHQTRTMKVDAPVEAGRTSTGKREVAGFGYRLNGEATGSMTTAGIAVVELCRRGLGDKLSSADQRKIDKSRGLAMGWMEVNFDVAQNPGRGHEWIYYYLYGLERVGALLGIDRIGAHAWYYEGAKHLVKLQRDDGTWQQHHQEPDTCFALLFLERATARGTGPDAGTPRDLLVSEEHDAEVRFRASGSHRMTVWITGISDEARQAHGVPRGTRRDLHLDRVEYWVDGALAETVECPPTAWQGEAHATRLTFDGAGDHVVRVRVVLALPEDADPLTADPVVLESDELSFELDAGLQDWMLEVARATGSTHLADLGCEATATCSADANRGPSSAIDGLQSTAWLCRTDGDVAVLQLSFDRTPRARSLVLQQAATRPKDRYSFDVVREVEVRFPGTKAAPIRVELSSDPLPPTLVPLPEDLRWTRVEIEVLRTDDGGSSERLAGFAEVGLAGVGE